ncbi:MAG TPA: hypothetical protein VIK20_04685 [Bacteroidales bacterium]
MKHLFLFTFGLLIFVQAFAQVEKTSYRSWSDCYRISNKQCEVIIGASFGGRVLSFSLNGKNVIYENQEQNGKLLRDWEKERFDPDAGRFDFGPEHITQPIHDKTWMGEWKAEIIDKQTLRLTSIPDTLLGLECIREFKLHADSAILTISQTAINITDKSLIRHFWGRTLVKPGGTLFVPISPKSRFKCGWGRFLWNPNRIESPHEVDERVKVMPKIFTFHAVGKTLKGGTDATYGWMAYAVDDLVFLKQFKVNKNLDYSGSDYMTGIFYSNGKFCELEPCSPTYTLIPGDSIGFSEIWRLKAMPTMEISDKTILKLIR